MCVCQVVALVSLKYHPGPPCPSRPCWRASIEQPHGRFRGGPPAWQAAFGQLFGQLTPYAYGCQRRHLLNFRRTRDPPLSYPPLITLITFSFGPPAAPRALYLVLRTLERVAALPGGGFVGGVALGRRAL
jgi:hypothetical protein